MKKILLIILASLILPPPSNAKTLSDIKSVSNQQSCFSNVFENYESWVGFLTKRNPKFNKERFPFSQELFNRYKNGLECTLFHNKVDGISIRAYIIHPKSGGKHLPTIIYNRGGNGGFGSVNMGRMMNDLMPLAIEGFVVIGTEYRWEGSSAATNHKINGKSDEFGGIDQNEVNALLPIIEQLEISDSERVGVLGSSRGGMQSYLFAKSNPTKVKALVTKAGIADLFSFRDRDQKTAKMLATIIPDFVENEQEVLKDRSAIFWADSLPNIPILLIHAKDDKKVSYTDSKQLAEKLKSLNRPHQFVSFEDGGHNLNKHRQQIDEMIVGWFKVNL
jgi:dipeptidyl aminopeptidase/acylaminoacyl peptidase